MYLPLPLMFLFNNIKIIEISFEKKNQAKSIIAVDEIQSFKLSIMKNIFSLFFAVSMLCIISSCKDIRSEKTTLQVEIITGTITLF